MDFLVHPAFGRSLPVSVVPVFAGRKSTILFKNFAKIITITESKVKSNIIQSHIGCF